MEPLEDRGFYASRTQRDILLALLENPVIATGFFLTGGTALAVFYLHHRVSNDLDLFTRQEVDLAEIGFWAARIWPGESMTLRQARQFLSMLIRGVKVDFVRDPLSDEGNRPVSSLEEKHGLFIDTVRNISSNKLCTLAARFEPKDFVDFYFIFRKLPAMDLTVVLQDAVRKEALFDDPPTAAFQIEEGLRLIQADPKLLPALRVSLDYEDFLRFHTGLVERLYHSVFD